MMMTACRTARIAARLRSVVHDSHASRTRLYRGNVAEVAATVQARRDARPVPRSSWVGTDSAAS